MYSAGISRRNREDDAQENAPAYRSPGKLGKNRGSGHSWLVRRAGRKRRIGIRGKFLGCGCSRHDGIIRRYCPVRLTRSTARHQPLPPARQEPALQSKSPVWNERARGAPCAFVPENVESTSELNFPCRLIHNPFTISLSAFVRMDSRR